MSPPIHENPHERSATVKANFGSAGFAAALLLFFGFAVYAPFSQPARMFEHAHNIFTYGLRLGGILLGISALWSISGQLVVLALDAVATGVIGMMLLGTGLAMLADGGSSMLFLNVIFGVMFCYTALHHWRRYQGMRRIGSLRAQGEVADDLTRTISNPPPAGAEPGKGPGGLDSYTADLLRLRRRLEEEQAAHMHISPDDTKTIIPIDPTRLDAAKATPPKKPIAPPEAAPSAAAEDAREDPDEAAGPTTPGGGFLAQFGRTEDKKD